MRTERIFLIRTNYLGANYLENISPPQLPTTTRSSTPSKLARYCNQIRYCPSIEIPLVLQHKGMETNIRGADFGRFWQTCHKFSSHILRSMTDSIPIEHKWSYRYWMGFSFNSQNFSYNSITLLWMNGILKQHTVHTIPRLLRSIFIFTSSRIGEYLSQTTTKGIAHQHNLGRYDNQS